MITVDFLNIDNAKLAGRILPFWTRGRKMSLFFQALIYPLIYTHNAFKKWALERYIECHITAQKASLEWYLKYKLKSHFANENDEFFITQYVDELISCFSSGQWRNELKWVNNFKWANEKIDAELEGDLFNQIFVYAPPIVDTVNYDHEDYERDIRIIMAKYMINFNKINIIIGRQ